MDYARLGKSDLSVSRISFGCMSLEADNDSTTKLLHAAVEHGITLFDTADLYQKGLNEEIVGKALRPFRDKIILASKVGNQWRADGSGWDWNPTKAYILQAVEQSLKRLTTDYIDLYQLHGGTIDDPIDETIEAFELLKKQGKIRYYGISSIRPNVIREYVRRSNISSVMMQYNLLDRRPEESVFQLLKDNNIGILTRGNLAGGLLVDKEAKPYLTYNAAEVQAAKKAVQAISKSRSKTDTVLQFSFHHPAVTSAVVGIRTMHQLDESIHAIHAASLSTSDLDILLSANTANVYQDHR
jgi:aryl-alcohol dehydrogenase-like predicted oxidoreductase